MEICEGSESGEFGEKIFIFKFTLKKEKKRKLHGGPWHFNNSLIVLTEPIGLGDFK